MRSKLLVFLVKNSSLPRSFRESVPFTTSVRGCLTYISWNHGKRVQSSIDQSLKNAGLDYFDLVRDFWFSKSVTSFQGTAVVLDALASLRRIRW
jgi:hypothetical protein